MIIDAVVAGATILSASIQAGMTSCMLQRVSAAGVKVGPSSLLEFASDPRGEEDQDTCDSHAAKQYQTGDDSGITPDDDENDGLKPPKQIHRKPWLHAAVSPAPEGSKSAFVCRYCGASISSPNTSVRKKVNFEAYIYSYMTA